MGLRELKAELKQLDNDTLIKHIAELYKKYKPVKEYFDFFINPNEKEIIEQYKDKDYNGYDWDYYQLLTTDTGDLKRYTPADLNGDCIVDFSDFAEFSQYWLWGTE